MRKYVGTSVGAIISLMLSVGYTTYEIMLMSSAVQFSYPSVEDIVSSAISGYGIMKENPYVEMIGILLRAKYGFIPTMKELHTLTGKELIVVGSCITTGNVAYISHLTFPEMPCTVAIDISSRIPFVFTPILYDGHLYLDGGLHDHFPIS